MHRPDRRERDTKKRTSRAAEGRTHTGKPMRALAQEGQQRGRNRKVAHTHLWHPGAALGTLVADHNHSLLPVLDLSPLQSVQHILRFMCVFRCLGGREQGEEISVCMWGPGIAAFCDDLGEGKRRGAFVCAHARAKVISHARSKQGNICVCVVFNGSWRSSWLTINRARTSDKEPKGKREKKRAGSCHTCQ